MSKTTCAKIRTPARIDDERHEWLEWTRHWQHGHARHHRYKLSKNSPATATQWSKLGEYCSVAMASNVARRLGCGCRI